MRSKAIKWEKKGGDKILANHRRSSFENNPRNQKPKRTGKYDGKNPMFAQISPRGKARHYAYTWWRSGHITYHDEKWAVEVVGCDSYNKPIYRFEVEVIATGRFDYSPSTFQMIVQMQENSDCGFPLDYRKFPPEVCAPDVEFQQRIDAYKWEYIEHMFRIRKKNDE